VGAPRRHRATVEHGIDLAVAVLDTSVLVPRWSRITLQRLAVEPLRRYQPTWSEWIIAETWRVLVRNRVERAGRAGQAPNRNLLHRQANEMMWYLLDAMSMTSLAGRRPLPEPWPSLNDPDDAPIWATAQLAGAQFVISHDTRHYPPVVGGRHVYQGIEYVTTVEFVEDVLGLELTSIYGEPLPSRNIVRSGRIP
jgi:hypothetical protein